MIVLFHPYLRMKNVNIKANSLWFMDWSRLFRHWGKWLWCASVMGHLIHSHIHNKSIFKNEQYYTSRYSGCWFAHQFRFLIWFAVQSGISAKCGFTTPLLDFSMILKRLIQHIISLSNASWAGSTGLGLEKPEAVWGHWALGKSVGERCSVGCYYRVNFVVLQFLHYTFGLKNLYCWYCSWYI